MMVAQVGLSKGMEGCERASFALKKASFAMKKALFAGMMLLSNSAKLMQAEQPNTTT